MELADLVYIDENGYHYADYPSFLAFYTQEYQSIYGADVYIDPDSQDAANLASMALAAYQTAAIGAVNYNSRSPLYAQGVGLSTVVKINGISRQIATYSTADLLITGTAGTTIANGIATDTLNQKWKLPASVVIGGGGTITVIATADQKGAITAAANTITSIFTPTRGWQSVNNEAAATVGAPVESDGELRLRQEVSVANPSLTVFDGTKGAVANVPGVTASTGYENDTNSTDGNGIPAHSISMIAAGGDATAIAQAIALHKTPGTGTYGTTTETVYDSKGMPLDIHFYRPTVVTIKARVTLSANVGWSTDYEVLIQQAVANTINGFGIGKEVLITKLYAPAYLTGTPASSTFDISLIEIAKVADSFGTVNIPILFNEQPNCVYNVNVTIVVT